MTNESIEASIEVVLLLRWVRLMARSGEARRLREAAGVTQAEIAAACGVTGTAVSLWESGSRTPRGEAGERYARVLERLSKESTPA